MRIRWHGVKTAALFAVGAGEGPLTPISAASTWLVALCLATAACGDSGQTGSASCVGPDTCVCDTFGGKYMARARVVEMGPASMTLEIEQALTEDAAFGAADVGRRFSHSIPSAVPCSPHSYPVPSVGDSVLVAFSAHDYRVSDCPGYSECAARCQGTPDIVQETDCRDRCAESCVPDRSTEPVLFGGFVFPDGDTLSLGNSSQVTVQEARLFTDFEACFQVHPPPDAESCNDNPELESCAVRGAPGRNASGFGLGLALLAALIRRFLPRVARS